MRDPYATHELGLADVARRDPLDDLLNLLIFFQHRDLPAVAPITGSRPRGPPGQKSESDPRARSDIEAPTARSPTPCSPATSHDQVDPASAGDPPNIFSAESAPEQGTLADVKTAVSGRRGIGRGSLCGCLRRRGLQRPYPASILRRVRGGAGGRAPCGRSPNAFGSASPTTSPPRPASSPPRSTSPSSTSGRYRTGDIGPGAGGDGGR